MRIKNQAKVSQSIIRDVKSVVGSLYSMNAPHATGYVFDPAVNGKSIARGMFFDNGDDKSAWTYHLDYATGVLSKTIA